MNSNSINTKIDDMLARAEKYSQVYHLFVLVLLDLIKLKIITAQESVIDIILAITGITITAYVIGKLRNKNYTSMPYLKCLKCGKNIGPVGEWTCKCGWKSTFPDE